MKIIFLALSLTILVSFAPFSSISEVITHRTWQRMEEFSTLAATPNFEKFSSECNEDNQWSFRLDSTFNCNEGNVVCNPGDSIFRSYDGRWYVNETAPVPLLNLVIGEDTTSWKILSYSDTMLLLEKQYDIKTINRVRLSR